MLTPAGPEELTAGWLTSVLGGRGQPPCAVRSFEAERLDGEQGMTGQLVRLRLQYETSAPGRPETLIAKFSASDPGTRSLISALGHYEREVRFYESLAAGTPVRTPECHHAHLDAETGGALLLLEDVVDARNGNSIAGCSVDEVERVLPTLARLHAAWWRAAPLAETSWLRLRSLVAPDAMVGAFASAWPSFLEKLSIPVTSEITALGDRIREGLPAAAATLYDSGPRTLVHNDVQADNLFFVEADQDVVLIDWQMVTYARSVIDVAGWIRGQLEPRLRRSVEPRLVRDYHAALVGHGVRDYPLEQCLDDYHLATVLAPARLACAVGLSEGLRAHPGAFWDTLFLRYPD